MVEEKAVWSFGFGSNMDVEHLYVKKAVTVLDHTPAILKGWRMAFTCQGLHLVEPRFANTEKGGPSDEVHGVAIQLSKGDADKLISYEHEYETAWTTFEGYDGRVLQGFIFVAIESFRVEEALPSARYLSVLVKGAK